MAETGYRLQEPKWPTPEGEAGRIKVLVIMRETSDNLRTAGHPWAATTPVLLQCLVDAGFEVQLSNNLDRIKNPNYKPDGPGDSDEGNYGLAYFDVVLFHGKIERVDNQAVKALKDFVEGGKGLVVVHIASASFAIAPDGSTHVSDDWKRLVGSIWVYGISAHPEPPQVVQIHVSDPSHPIVAGLPSDFTLAREELYLSAKMVVDNGGPGHELARGTTYDVTNNVDVTEPVMFTLERDKGRVVNLYLGHFISTHRDWRFQRLITQGVQWVANR